MDSITLSPELKRRYEAQQEQLPFPVRGEYVSTSYGPVWVIEAGDPDAPPLIALHGLQTPAPFNLEFFAELTKHFRVICPDILGQAGRTPGMAPAPVGHGYAMWVDQLMNALKIESCPMVGLSFGGAVLLDLASYKPERIERASLVVPAGFFRPIWRPLKKIIAPFLSFKIHSDFAHFGRLMKPLMDENWPALENYFYAVFEAGIPLALVPPGPFQREDLCDFHSPVQLISCRDDIYFDADKLAKHAKNALLNLTETHVFDDLHIPTQENRQLIQKEVSRFLQQ